VNRFIPGLAITVAFGLAACGGDDGGDAANPDAPEVCTLPAEGECDGNVFRHCVDGFVTTQDCTGLQQSCRRVDTSTHGCVDDCAVAGATEAGTCDGNSIQRCDLVGGVRTVVTEACGSGNVCSEAGGAAACVTDLCAGIGALGRCNGDTAERCAGGQPTSTDCTLTGQVCGFGGDTAGYVCVASTGFAVQGTVRYEDREPLTSGALGSITTKVVRGARVAVILDSSSSVLATGYTADDGSYALTYDATAGAMVHVLVTAQSTLPARPIRVMRTQNAVHGFGGPAFAAAATATQNLLVTDASATSEAFNIFDQSVLAMDVIRDSMGNPTPTPLTARWSRGSNNGTYYSGRTIFLLGASSDDDGYDDTVILHEIGHFVEDTEGRSDSPGGGHDGSPTDPRLAWSEGFSTYFNMAVRGAPWYMDSNSGGGWGYNADTEVTRAMGAGSIGQDVSEDMVSQILWDIGDGGAGDDDAHAGNHTDVLRVQVDYLASASLRNIGQSGVDLVDFLDGWFLAEGLSSCAGVRGVVTTAHSFPYDYAGPGGSCP
jgi:hypothetical protein